jgi:serine/threonine-protein kinase
VFTPTALAIAVCGANTAVLYFLHYSADAGKLPRWIALAYGAIGLAHFLDPLSVKLTVALTIAIGVVTIPFSWHIASRLARIARNRAAAKRAHRFEARLMLGMMMTTGLVLTPDIIGLFSGHAALGGAHTISIGILGFLSAEAVVLANQFVGRQHELERNEAELRRQVAERSRELSDALAQLAARPQPALLADRVIAERYRVIGKLGAGGMGAVYEVERVTDRERLALKTLRGRAEPDIMARFAREAQIAAETSHPNLVPVLDVGIADGGLFLVMPLVTGGSLEQQRAKFGDAAWAKPVLAQIAAGLAALHARSIVHRDLKPANVLLAGGVARIADFGLAALRADAADAHGDTVASSDALADTASPSPPLTRAGDIFGTPGYMAPELAAGARDVAPAADMFAFGVIAYELAVGRPPYAEPPVFSRMHGRAIATPPLDAIGEPLRGVVARCLDVDPAKRPAAAEVVAALR